MARTSNVYPFCVLDNSVNRFHPLQRLEQGGEPEAGGDRGEHFFIPISPVFPGFKDRKDAPRIIQSVIRSEHTPKRNLDI